MGMIVDLDSSAVMRAMRGVACYFSQPMPDRRGSSLGDLLNTAIIPRIRYIRSQY